MCVHLFIIFLGILHPFPIFIACNSTCFGSKAQVTSADDVLQVDEDTYLSEIDNLDEVVTATRESSAKERKLKATGGLTGGFGSAETTGELPAHGLFPHSPKKRGNAKNEPRVKSTVVVVNNNQSSVNRNLFKTKAKTHQQAGGRNSNRTDLKRAVEKVQNQSRNREKPRQATFIANPPHSAHKTARAKRTQPSVFAHLNQSIVNPLKSYHIPRRPIQVNVPNATATSSNTLNTIPSPSPVIAAIVHKTFASVGVQTEPCRCQLRNKQKNHNRRIAAKLIKAATSMAVHDSS